MKRAVIYQNELVHIDFIKKIYKPINLIEEKRISFGNKYTHRLDIEMYEFGIKQFFGTKEEMEHLRARIKRLRNLNN